jgi:hypothetical protein
MEEIFAHQDNHARETDQQPEHLRQGDLIVITRLYFTASQIPELLVW